MKYSVIVGERTFDVVIDGEAVTVDGTAVHAVLSRETLGRFRTLTIDGERHRLTLTRSGEAWLVQRLGAVVPVLVEDERQRHMREAVGTGSVGNGRVVAPMPGLVHRVMVSSGDEVQIGTGLLVLEAMKMENEIKSPVNGKVLDVQAVEGSAVEKGAVLVKIEPVS